MMAKKFSVERELKKARELMASDSKLFDVVKQVTKVSKDAKVASGGHSKGGLRVPYVNAEPIVSTSWK